MLQWVTALKALDASYYCFVHCRPCMVDQFNLVDSFPQRGEMISFYAVFICQDCEKEVDLLVNRCSNFRLDSGPPEVACPACGGRAEFDEVPELYFRYILSTPAPRPPPAANNAIGIGPEQADEGRGRRFEMKKEVEGGITVFWMSGFLDRPHYFKRAHDGVEGGAMLEISQLEGLSEAGRSGLGKFLSRLQERAVLARVPAVLVEPLSRLFADEPKLSTSIVSFLIPLRCTGCESIFAADIEAEGLSALVAGQASEVCPRCFHPLEPQWSEPTAARAAALPLAAAPPEVHAYLEKHPPTGRTHAGDRMASSIDPRRLLLGKYQILQPLGRGGMGEVFLARQIGPEDFEKLVVLKRVRRDRLGDGHSRDMFLKEARIAACLSHQNIVQIFDLERMGDEYLISMEYVNGIDLASALDLSRSLQMQWPIEVCCRVLADLCNALHAAHTYVDADGRPSPIIHRDVSPSNILLSTEGAVKLTDFGIARAASDPTESPAVFGKAGYAAPEQSDSTIGPTSERTDIFAAGVVLYECLTLRPVSRGPTMQPTTPFPGARIQALAHICVARSGATPLLQDVFERATHADPADRYRTVRELGRDLERIGRLVSEISTDDLALWIRRLVALRLEASGHQAAPIITIHTGSAVSGSLGLAKRRASEESGRR